MTTPSSLSCQGDISRQARGGQDHAGARSIQLMCGCGLALLTAPDPDTELKAKRLALVVAAQEEPCEQTGERRGLWRSNQNPQPDHRSLAGDEIHSHRAQSGCNKLLWLLGICASLVLSGPICK